MLRLPLKLGFGGLLGAIVASTGLIFSNIWTYQRLTHEIPVAQITFKALGKQHYQVRFTDLTKHKEQAFELKGDEWQLDARVLKWKAWANLLGKDPLYQLDRISGRYQDVQIARQTLRAIHAFSEQGWLDPWHLARDYPQLFFMADASYGSSVYLPMQDGASYDISMSTTGLLARPVAPLNNP